VFYGDSVLNFKGKTKRTMKRLLFLLLFLFINPTVKANHILGGEISYQCLGNGNFRFRVVIFRDCSGINYNTPTINLAGPVGVSCNLISSYDVTPRGPNSGNIRCDPPSSFGGTPANKGGIGKFIYEGTANLNSLGVAPLNGYTWTTSNIPCCRNANVNMNCSGSMILRVTMYRFVDPNGVALTPSQICDNSPIFLEDPAAVTILNPFDTSTFNNFAQDRDRTDDVRFYIDFPWNNVNQACSFSNGYSVNNPLPSMVGPGIDSITGIMKYRPTVNGGFQLGIRAESRRCGQKISEIFRDFQLNIIINPPGARPPFNPLLPDSIKVYQQKAPIFVPFLFDQFGDPVYEVEIYAEDTLIFPLQAYDLYALFDPPTATVPFPMYNPDEVSLFVTGPQMGTNGTSTTTGCLYPPCATISQQGGAVPAPIRYFPTGEILGYGFSNDQAVSAQLNWVPSCNNLPDSTLSSCGAGLAAYQFGVVAFDDASPVRGKNSQVYAVKVKSLPDLPTPIIRTVSAADDNQAVVLSWSQPIDTITIDPIDSTNLAQFPDTTKRRYSVERRKRSFREFRVYRADNPAGPFALAGITYNLTDTTFEDQTVSPQTDYYYYVVSVSGCANKESDPSDTLKTIRLNLTNNQSLGRAELSWDSLGIQQPYPATATGLYLIEKSVFPAPFQLVDSVQDLYSWWQEVVVCDDSVNYRVGLRDSSGWVSYSWVMGDRFEDIFAPNAPEIVQASIDAVTQLPYLSWTAPTNADTRRYVIYRVDIGLSPPALFALDTINDPNQLYWQDIVSGQNPNDSALQYAIASIDSCGNLGVSSTTHHTVWLQSRLDICASSVQLSWTNYLGWSQTVKEYQIYRQDGAGAPWSLLATMAGGVANYSYVDNQQLIQDTTYCYQVVAVRQDDSTAFSNTSCMQARVIQAPQYTYLRKVSVDTATTQLQLSFLSDTAASSNKFVLLGGSNPNQLLEKAVFDPSQAVIWDRFYQFTYTDPLANPAEGSVWYQVKVYDVCDQLLDSSELVSSIFLQGNPGVDFVNNLKWNDYNGFLGGTQTYQLVRRIPAKDPQFIPVQLTGFGSPVIADNIEAYTDNDGRYDYLVEALEGNTNPLGINDTVYSNVVSLIQQPRIFFPNAFLPQGINREFIGKGVFIEEKSGFQMEIYNRWGELIFESNDYTLGWDGRLKNNQMVEQGVYVYVVHFKGKDQKTYSQRGSITVLR
jgi:gliding motility-associated-like protein